MKIVFKDQNGKPFYYVDELGIIRRLELDFVVDWPPEHMVFTFKGDVFITMNDPQD